MSNKNTLQGHYQNVAADYEKHLNLTTDHVDIVTTRFVNLLEMKKSDVLVDLGCGTGMYAKSICAKLDTDQPIFCVDNSQSMLNQLPDNGRFTPVLQGAVEFAQADYRYDKVLAKAVIQHIPQEALPTLYAGIYKGLRQEGIFIINMSNRDQFTWPLFEKALLHFRAYEPDCRDVAAGMQAVGFKVDINHFARPMSMPKDRYYNMIRQRAISIFSFFTDEELEEGILELEEKFLTKEVLELEIVSVVVRGRK